ncbi:MAG: TlpA family protein disulfide reductase [Marinifilum sp.]|nr:TlpA family protein disulfide reductase [Marinifilum sp.]
MYKYIVVVCVFLSMLSCKKEDKTVRLKGELKNFGIKEYFMSKGSPRGILLKEGIAIRLDEKNRFEVSFELEEPTYYRLGRNTLYLSPGDDIQLFCDFKNPKAGKFTGKGAEACLYLRTKPFPKGGSFMNSAMLKDKPSYEEVLKRINNEVKERLVILKETPNLSDLFRKLERGRVMFSAANSLLSYPSYDCLDFVVKEITSEEELENKLKYELEKLKKEVGDYFDKSIKAYISEGGDADFLQIEVYRYICKSCVELLGEENVDNEVLDFIKTRELLDKLSRNGPVLEVLEKKQKMNNLLKGNQYKKIVEKVFKEYDALLPGKPAPELLLSNREGEEVKLSDFKGKMVVVDVWATWCGPCLGESPYFEKLAEKFKNKNVTFIAVSIDRNKKTWERFLNKHPKITQQFITNRMAFASYKLDGIPRFLVFDHNGLIVDVFAARPSDPKLEELIRSNI